MTSVRFPLLCSLAILVVALMPLSSAHAEFKKTKIAVLDFQQQGEELSSKDVGKIVAEWLITGLVETGRFEVVERRLLEKLLDEQKLGITGAIDPTSAAQLGKILGVKTIVSGTISSLEGTTEINARLISVDTASIITAVKVQARSAGRLNDLVSEITEKIAASFPLEGYVVQRAGARITIDLGQQVGVRAGMHFVAYKEGKVIKHPKTGEVLDVETIELGVIEIKDVRNKTASGVILHESSPNGISYGSMVRSGEGTWARDDSAPSPPDEKTEKPAERKETGERRGIPIPDWLKRK